MTTRNSLVHEFLWMLRIGPLLAAFVLTVSHAVAAPVTHIQVKVTTGAVELTAGSYVELRIYEAGKAVRHLALTHDETWPRDSTLVIPLTLAEALDQTPQERQAMSQREIAHVRTHFTSALMAARTLAVYRELLPATAAATVAA